MSARSDRADRRDRPPDWRTLNVYRVTFDLRIEEPGGSVRRQEDPTEPVAERLIACGSLAEAVAAAERIKDTLRPSAAYPMCDLRDVQLEWGHVLVPEGGGE
jgi:hypothetical protein